MNSSHANSSNQLLDWNDTIESSSAGYLEGDYNFTVTKLQRSFYEGGENIPACPQAIVTLRVETDCGTVSVRVYFLLHVKFQARIYTFFRSLGFEAHDNKIAMNWFQVEGCQGRAYFKPREIRGWNGRSRMINYPERFYTKEKNDE